MDDKRAGAPETVAPGQTCQVCGAETHTDVSLCDACAHTVDTIVDTPLPPIPDGGLLRAMPAWLRSSPHAPLETSRHPGSTPNEFSSILSDEDIPLWLKRMAERHAASLAPAVKESATTGSTEEATQSVLTATTATTPAAAPTLERRVMVGTGRPQPIEPSSPPPAPSRLQRPPIGRRTALAIGILAAIVALIILAILLFG